MEKATWLGVDPKCGASCRPTSHAHPPDLPLLSFRRPSRCPLEVAHHARVQAGGAGFRRRGEIRTGEGLTPPRRSSSSSPYHQRQSVLEQNPYERARGQRIFFESYFGPKSLPCPTQITRPSVVPRKLPFQTSFKYPRLFRYSCFLSLYLVVNWT